MWVTNHESIWCRLQPRRRRARCVSSSLPWTRLNAPCIFYLLFHLFLRTLDHAEGLEDRRHVAENGPRPAWSVESTSSFPDMPAAVPRVLEIPELVERILLALPMQDLLLCQRTCKAWCDLVLKSPNIQRALFFLPLDGLLYAHEVPQGARLPRERGDNDDDGSVGNDDEELEDEDDDEPNIELRYQDGRVFEGGHRRLSINSLLLGKYPTFDNRSFIQEVILQAPRTLRVPTGQYPRRNSSGNHVEPSVDEDREPEDLSDTSSASSHESDWDAYETNIASSAPKHTLCLVKFLHAQSPAFNHPTASWRKMLLSQPPTAKLEIVDLRRESSQDYHNASGMRLSDIAGSGGAEVTGWDPPKWWVILSPGEA